MSNPFRIITSFGTSAFARYKQHLVQSPLKTKMISAGIVSIIGDVICQKLIEKKSWADYSFKRTLRQCSVSLLYNAPMGHVWFGKVLPKIVKPIEKRSLRVLASVILDNTFYASYIIATGVFFLEFLKTGSVEASVENVQKKFMKIWMNSVGFWTSMSLIGHSFVPQPFKVLFGNACGVVWQVYMSYMVNAAKPNQQGEASKSISPSSLGQRNQEKGENC